MKKFWKWKNQAETETAPAERTLFLNGTIAEESWFDDDVTPQLFKEELMGGSGDITVWINSPGGDCVAAAQIYNMLMDYPEPCRMDLGQSIRLDFRHLGRDLQLLWYQFALEGNGLGGRDAWQGPCRRH